VKPPRVLCYVRVSTQTQTEKWSLAAQRRALTEYAERQGWEILGWHDDPGISGKNIDERPGMLALLADVVARKPEFILVVELERLSRGGGGDWDKIVDTCAAAGTKLATPTQTLDPNAPEDSFLTDLFAALSRRERRKTAERSKRGTRERVRSGRWPGGSPPFGYVLGPEGRLAVKEEEAVVVRRIFRELLNGNTYWGLSCAFNREGVATQRRCWYADTVAQMVKDEARPDDSELVLRVRRDLRDGGTCADVARALNREGVPTERPGAWYASAVARITTNRAYVGEVHLGDGHHRRKVAKDPVVVTDAHPAIVRADEFERLAEITRARNAAKLPRSRRASGYFLTGLFPCPKCGDRMVGATTRRRSAAGVTEHRYYICTAQFRPNGKYCGRVRADDVEAALLKEMARVLSGPDVVERVRRRCVEDVMRGSTDLQKRRSEIETALAESRRRVEVMYGDRLSGALSLDTYTRIAKGEEERQTAYETALTEMESEVLALGRGVDVGRLLGLLKDVRHAMTALALAELKELVQIVVGEVRVAAPEPISVAVRWRLPGMATEASSSGVGGGSLAVKSRARNHSAANGASRSCPKRGIQIVTSS
jgi:site-specific DNA recombinase